MTETVAQRITQLESIVNELTARVAADPGNVDLPPLLTAAQVELTDLQAAPAAPAASAVPAAAQVATAAAPAAPAKAAAPVSRPKMTAPAAKLNIKPEPPTVPALMRTRPNPASPRPLPTRSRAGR